MTQTDPREINEGFSISPSMREDIEVERNEYDGSMFARYRDEDVTEDKPYGAGRFHSFEENEK